MLQAPLGSGVGRKASAPYEMLRSRIIRAQIPFSQKLELNVLSEHFQISISPVREALARLAAEGYIGRDVGGGYYIKPFSVEEQRDLLQLMLIIFSGAITLTRSYLPTALLQDAARFEAADDQEEAYAEKLGEVFLGVMAATHNQAIIATSRSLWDRTFAATVMDFRLTGVHRDADDVLRSGASAILDGDLARAAKVAERYVEGRIERLVDAVRMTNHKAGNSGFP